MLFKVGDNSQIATIFFPQKFNHSSLKTDGYNKFLVPTSYTSFGSLELKNFKNTNVVLVEKKCYFQWYLNVIILFLFRNWIDYLIYLFLIQIYSRSIFILFFMFKADMHKYYFPLFSVTNLTHTLVSFITLFRNTYTFPKKKKKEGTWQHAIYDVASFYM